MWLMARAKNAVTRPQYGAAGANFGIERCIVCAIAQIRSNGRMAWQHGMEGTVWGDPGCGYTAAKERSTTSAAG